MLGKNRNLIRFLFGGLLLAASFSSMAWTNSLSVGYGQGEDPNHPRYKNSGVFANVGLVSLFQRSWVKCIFNGAVGRWYTNAPTHKDVTTAALSVAFRFYVWNNFNFHPFVLASAGPAYLSKRQYGENRQGMNFAFQSILGAGFEAGSKRRLDLNLRFVHYSNAYTSNPNQGYNIFYVVSVGILI